MTKIVAVTNNKGGVGKTHTVFHLCGAYAELGKKVLAIDIDPQGNLTGLFVSDAEGRGSLYDILVDDVPLSRVVMETEFDGISVVPSSKKLQNIDALLQNEADSQIRLADSIQEFLRENPSYDLVLLDCPPSLGLPTRNALAAADYVVIPLEADKFSVEGLDTLVQSIKTMKRVVNPRLEIAGILISLFKGRRTVENLYERALRAKALPMFETRIKDSAKYREAITVRKPITYYKPKTEFAEAFRNLTRELEAVYAC